MPAILSSEDALTTLNKALSEEVVTLCSNVIKLTEKAPLKPDEKEAILLQLEVNQAHIVSKYQDLIQAQKQKEQEVEAALSSSTPQQHKMLSLEKESALGQKGLFEAQQSIQSQQYP